MIRKQIETKIKKEFNPFYLDVINESDHHNVPTNSESHFKVILVSDRFNGEHILNRHRAIYSVLEKELGSVVHALSLYIYTVKEWETLKTTALDSPSCHGT